MSQFELVSIILPTYNSSAFILETVDSILAQEYTFFELIIVDDGSLDGTIDLLKDYVKGDNRVVIIKLEINSGVAVARNVGISRARGRYIAFCDSDDIWLSNKLILQISFMQKKLAPISYTSYDLISERGILLNKRISSLPKLGYRDYLGNTIIGLSTSIIDSQMVGKFHFENLRIRQDTLLWLTLLKNGHNAFGMPESLVKYRVRNNSISSNKLRAALHVWRLYYYREKLGLASSVYYFSSYIFNAFKKRF